MNKLDNQGVFSQNQFFDVLDPLKQNNWSLCSIMQQKRDRQSRGSVRKDPSPYNIDGITNKSDRARGNEANLYDPLFPDLID